MLFHWHVEKKEKAKSFVRPTNTFLTIWVLQLNAKDPKTFKPLFS